MKIAGKSQLMKHFLQWEWNAFGVHQFNPFHELEMVIGTSPDKSLLPQRPKKGAKNKFRFHNFVSKWQRTTKIR